MRSAILSACFGSIPQMLARESSVLVLYATLLGANRFLSLTTTSLQYLSVFVLNIPMAYLMERTGKKRLMLPALSLGLLGLLAVAGAGFFPDAGRAVLLGGLIVFSLTLAVYVAGWFPLVQGLVPESQRGRFFGRMRVIWQSLVASVSLVCTWFIGRSASTRTIQLIYFSVAVLVIGRVVFMSRVPEVPRKRDIPSLREQLGRVLSNPGLRRFSAYVFVLYLFSSATVPLAFVFARLELGVPDNYLVLLSACMDSGSILGYYIGGRMVDRYNTRTVFFAAHLALGVLNILFFGIYSYSAITAVLLALLVGCYGLAHSASTIATSSETLALAQKDYLNTSIAFSVAFNYAGIGLSRVISGYLLEAGVAANPWSLLGLQVTNYHTFFGCYGAILLGSFVLVFLIPPLRTKRRQLPGY
jgi:predicted MFS family arabinose efflux permease